MTGTRLQLVTPADMPRIWELSQEQNGVEGTDFAVPRIFDEQDRQVSNVPLALKLVDGGRIVKAHIFERQLELLDFGVSRRGTLLSLREMPAAMWVLEQMGYTGFHGRAPAAHVERWEQTLGKRLRMTRDDERLAHYYREFRGSTG